ncbi:MAG: QueT transporter family protein [Clostridia bacterium]|nr:QueT transporter family protein [Clostridia bacterium]
MMNRNKTKELALSGMIAALYVVLTWLANAMGLASGAVQVRFSEALTILPVFFTAAVPGLTVGCILANLLTGLALWDVVFGSLATLIGAAGTRMLRNKPLIAWIPPVLSNMLIVPIVLMKVYGAPESWFYLVLTVGAGEVISCGVLGLLLYHGLKKVVNTAAV